MSHSAGISKAIVVVDDEAAPLNLCSSALRRAGYHVLVASTAKQAMAFFQPNRTPIALALIDISMAEMSGLEQPNPPKRIVLMSGSAPDDVRKLVGTEAANYRCIWKPLQADTLLRLVRNVMDAPAPVKKSLR